MRNQRHFTACLSLLFITFFGQTVLAQSVQKRNLARYDDGGSFDFNWGLGPKAHERMRPKLRKFIWEHWSQKRLGHVIVTFYTIEGDPTTHNLYIEPDESGQWRIVSEYESECCWFYAMEKKKRQRQRSRGVETYDTVERIKQINDGKGTWKVIPEGESRQPNTYWLRIRRKNYSADAALTL